MCVWLQGGSSNDSFPSSMSEGSLVREDTSAVSRGQRVAELPSMGIWSVLRPWVGDCPAPTTQSPASKPRLDKAQDKNTHTTDFPVCKGDAKTFEDRVQAMAAASRFPLLRPPDFSTQGVTMMHCRYNMRHSSIRSRHFRQNLCLG